MFRIFGPPGTGKTTTLLNMVDEALENGTRPQEIAFLAFTRKAANEAKERASSRFNLCPQNDLIHFRTIHSLALTRSDIQKDQVMQPENYQELSKITGVTLIGSNDLDTHDDLPTMKTGNTPVMNVINLARLRKIPLRKQYNESNIEEDWNLVNHVFFTLKKYKETYGLFDFTDMLEQFAQQGARCCPQFKLTFLDEAQDLSPLQWDIAHMLDTKSERMYCAGDDDQAIYRWAGADVNHFINLPGGSEILSKSWRIPSSVHALAEQIAAKIYNRFPKKYYPRTEMGAVERIDSINSLDMSAGTWLVLAQAGYQLQPVSNDLKANGYLFNYRGHRSISERVSVAVNGWEQLRKGKSITLDAARKVYEFMSVGNRVARGYKKLRGLDEEELVDYEILKKNGLLADISMIWHIALDRVPDDERAYIIALLRRGEKFNAEPRITVSTIHGSKGGEAENVVLYTNLSPAADAHYQTNPDDLHRTFYVAVTRTKENLFIIEPENMNRSYDL